MPRRASSPAAKRTPIATPPTRITATARQRARSPAAAAQGSSALPPAKILEFSGSQLRFLIGIITFLDTFAVGLVNPIYPLLVKSDLLGATLFALIMSASNAAALMGSTIYGRIADVHGRRLAVIASACTTCLGFILYVVGFACEGVFPKPRMLLPAAGRIISGMGRAALAGPLLAMLADHADNKNTVAQDTTRVVATFGFGYAAGSGVGGYILSVGGTWLNLAFISLCICAQVLCAWQLPPDNGSSDDESRPSRGSRSSQSSRKAPPTRGASASMAAVLRAALAIPTTRALLLVQALTAASFHVYDSTGAIYMQDHLGFTPPQRGYILSYAGWMFALQTFFAVPWLVSSGFQQGALLCYALLCTGIGRVGLACATFGYPTLAIVSSYPILNLGQGMSHTLLKALMSKAAAAEDRGLLLGVLESVSKSFGVLGPMLGGPIYDALGPPAPAMASCILAFMGALAAAALAVEPDPTQKAKQL